MKFKCLYQHCGVTVEHSEIAEHVGQHRGARMNEARGLLGALTRDERVALLSEYCRDCGTQLDAGVCAACQEKS